MKVHGNLQQMQGSQAEVGVVDLFRWIVACAFPDGQATAGRI